MTVESLLRDRRTASDPISTVTAPRVAFQGELGAYGDEAIIQQWDGRATATPSASFEQVVTDVATGFADLGIVPVWNSIVGEIEAGIAAIRITKRARSTTQILGDIHLIVRHQLLGLRGSVLADIRSVASHPVALAQCTGFLRNHPWIEAVPSYDTAGAARQLATSGPPSAAAIAGCGAAKRYDLSILQTDVQDVADNVTQFLIIARTSGQALETGHHSGSTGHVRW